MFHFLGLIFCEQLRFGVLPTTNDSLSLRKAGSFKMICGVGLRMCFILLNACLF